MDILLVVMVLIWGANFSLVKVALHDFPELAFNAFRMSIAAALFLSALAWQRYANRDLVSGAPGAGPKVTTGDWVRIAGLGLVGHTMYQLCFLGGVKRTSVANASLIIGISPVLVALLSSWSGHERVPMLRWVGAGLSFAGLLLVVGPGVTIGPGGRVGDLLMCGASICWAVYSVASVPLLKRHSPMVVTGLSMAVGAAAYLVITAPTLVQLDWTVVSAFSWWLMVASAVFALAVAYLIWYTSVQRIGSTRTAVWNNLTPIAAIAIAAVWVGEPVSWNQLAGAVAIFAGLFVTRIPR